MMHDLASVLQRVQALETSGRRKEGKVRVGSKGGLVFVAPSRIATGAGVSGWKRASAARHVRGSARAVLLNVSLRTGLGPGAPFTLFDIEAKVSANGSVRKLLQIGTSVDQSMTVQALCALSPSKGFEFRVTSTGAPPGSYDLTVVAYWADA